MGRWSVLIAVLLVACSKGGDNSSQGDSIGSGDASMEVIHLTVGTGESPLASDTVVVHYHGTFADGKVFDSSVERGRPATFPLNRVIKCWTEGLQEMKVGGKAKLICPPQVAYGAAGKPPKIPKNATLHFEVELLEIK